MSSSVTPQGELIDAEAPVRQRQVLGPYARLLRWGSAAGWRGAALVVGVWVALIAWGEAVLWLSGRLPVGAVDPELIVLSAYAPFSLMALIVGTRIAMGALDRFWPATGWPDRERSLWVTRFTDLPAREEWLMLGIGVLLGLGTFLASPASLLGPESGRLWTYLAYLPTYLAGYATALAGSFVGLRWLRLVARIHREAQAVDPFDRGPVYAFSRLTGWSGFVYIGGLYYTLAFNPFFQTENALAIAILVISMAVGFLLFTVPLWGIHTRLIQEKAGLMSDVERRTAALGAEMYARIDAGAFDSTKGISDSLLGLSTLRDRIEHLPTWPWPPQLFRGFLSALLLPVVVYVLTRLLSNLLS